MSDGSYVLITPAKNEERHIERTIKSVVDQLVRPARWVIVDDGSTDATEDIAMTHAAKHSFIEVLSRPPGSCRGFASKVFAFRLGYHSISHLKFSYVGNLDADVTFEPAYYARMIGEFMRNRKLGVAGGWVYEEQQGDFRSRFGNVFGNVAGAVQLYRRECLEQIGGFPALPYGGEDTAAQALVRMHGWQVRSFQYLRVKHLKPPSAKMFAGGVQKFREGIRDYALGYNPIYFLLKCVRRVRERPFVVGSTFRLLGYLWSCIRRAERPLNPAVMAFMRREQMKRLWSPQG